MIFKYIIKVLKFGFLLEHYFLRACLTLINLIDIIFLTLIILMILKLSYWE